MSVALQLSQVVLDVEWGPAPAPLDLEVPAGAFHIVETAPARLGPLVRVCLGLRAPLAGTVQVLGQPLGQLCRGDFQRLRRRMGVGLRPGGLTSNLTIRMNVVTPLLYGGADAPDPTLRADEVLEECGLTPWADRRPDDVPPDVRQGAVVARAIARRPELLVLEDPLSAVDAAQAERLLRVCRDSADTILVATRRASGALRQVADLRTVWTTQHPSTYEVGAN